MTTAEILKQARALIEDPARWCQDAIARDAEGQQVHEQSTTAVRWCAVGAWERVSPWDSDGYEYLSRAASEILASAGRAGSPVTVNNDLGHAAVLEMFSRAIALAESEVTR